MLLYYDYALTLPEEGQFSGFAQQRVGVNRVFACSQIHLGKEISIFDSPLHLLSICPDCQCLVLSRNRRKDAKGLNGECSHQSFWPLENNLCEFSTIFPMVISVSISHKF